MTLTADTYRSTESKSRFKSRLFNTYSNQDNSFWILNYNLKGEYEDVFIVVGGIQDQIITDFTEIELTRCASELSELSFNELWKDEDDNYWDSYI